MSNSYVQKFKVVSQNQVNKIYASNNAFIYYTNLSKEWANKINGTVDGEEYSSKYYSQKARQYCDDAIAAINQIRSDISTGNGIISDIENNPLVAGDSGWYVDLEAVYDALDTSAARIDSDIDSITSEIGNLEDLSLQNKSSVVAAINSLVSEKAGVDLDNAVPTSAFATAMDTAGIRTVIETYANGTSWYRVYSDGWCEQGGYSSPATSTITFLKQFSNINYTLITQPCNKAGTNGSATYMVTFNHTVTGFTAIANTSILSYEWQACGYIR